jgi:CBS domain-containing protein
MSFTISVGDIVADKRLIIHVSWDSSIRKCLEILANENLISLPVYGQPERWIGYGGIIVVANSFQYIGIVNLADLFLYILQGSSTDERMSQSIYNVLGTTDESLTLWAENCHEKLSYILERFSKGIHHGLVFDPSDSTYLVKILSSTDIVKYFSSNLTEFPLLQRTFNNAAGIYATKDVKGVSSNSKMLEALNLLRSVTALPVLDPFGELIATLSLSDLKGGYKLLYDGGTEVSVIEFLQFRHNGNIPLPVYVNQSEPLRIAVNLMLTNKIHRVWIRQCPNIFRDAIAGVLSLSDVIRAVYEADCQLLRGDDCRKFSNTIDDEIKDPMTK